MREYQSNSHKSRELATEVETEKRAKKVVTGDVAIKKNEGRKVVSMFVSEDVHSVKNYVVEEVIVPMIKNGIVEAAKTFIEMIFLGSDKTERRRTSLGDRVSYRRYYDDRNSIRYEDPVSSSNKFDYRDIVLKKRVDAERVILEMKGILKGYGIVRIGDLYDLVDETPPHTAFDYGWTDLSRAAVKPVRDGYMIVLPKAMPID